MPPTRIAAPSRRSARRWRVLIDRSSSPRGCSGSHRGAWRPNGTGSSLDPATAHLSGGPQTRWATAQLTLSLASRGVRSSVVRLSPTVTATETTASWRLLVGIARDKGRLRLHRRRVQPLARRASARCRAPLPPGAGDGPGGIGAARGRRRGRADPRHRRGDRAASRRAGGSPSPPRTQARTSACWPASWRSTARPRAR